MTEPGAEMHAALVDELRDRLRPGNGLAAILGGTAGDTPDTPERSEHGELIADLTSRLDVGTRLNDITGVESGHADLVTDLAEAIDTETGLAGVLGVPDRATSPTEATPHEPELPTPDRTPPTIEQVADDLRRLHADRLRLLAGQPQRYLEAAARDLTDIREYLRRPATAATTRGPFADIPVLLGKYRALLADAWPSGSRVPAPTAVLRATRATKLENAPRGSNQRPWDSGPHMVIGPDGTWLATAEPGALRMWSREGRLLWTKHVELVAPGSLVASADGRYLVTTHSLAGSSAEWIRRIYSIMVWDRESGRLHREERHVDAYEDLWDGTYLIRMDENGRWRVVEMATGDLIGDLGDEGKPIGMAGASGGFWYADQSRERILFWDRAARTAQRRLIAHRGGISRLVVAPDGTWVATMSDDVELEEVAVGRVQVWDVATETLRFSLPHGPALTAQLYATQAGLATEDSRGTVVMWDATTGALRHEIATEATPAARAISPDGTWFAAITDDDDLTLRIFDLPATPASWPHAETVDERTLDAFAASLGRFADAVKDLAKRLAHAPGGIAADLRDRCLGETDRLALAVEQLWIELTDFRGADLSGAEFTDPLDNLDGVRWSTATRWPDTLLLQIVEHSVDGPAPGEFVLRFGSPVTLRYRG